MTCGRSIGAPPGSACTQRPAGLPGTSSLCPPRPRPATSTSSGPAPLPSWLPYGCFTAVHSGLLQDLATSARAGDPPRGSHLLLQEDPVSPGLLLPVHGLRAPGYPGNDCCVLPSGVSSLGGEKGATFGQTFSFPPAGATRPQCLGGPLREPARRAQSFPYHTPFEAHLPWVSS